MNNVRDSTQGMARWVARGPVVNNEDDMDDYMHEVAGRVGYLLTQLFAWYSFTVRWHKDALMPLAREFGLALQTVNVIRGLREDYERGWIFVPETFCHAVNIRREDLFKPEHRAEAIQVLDMLADKAERHLHAALGLSQGAAALAAQHSALLHFSVDVRCSHVGDQPQEPQRIG